MTQPRQPTGAPTGGRFAANLHSESTLSLNPPHETTWLGQNDGIFVQTIQTVAEQLRIFPLAVEKDYWVCQALRAIESHSPGGIIFKGGTSLEKIRLIERFSEDLDLLVTADFPSSHAGRRGLKAMCAAARDALPNCEETVVNRGGKAGSFHRSVYLSLPLQSRAAAPGLADPESILVELGQSGGRNPSTRRAITSLLGRRLEQAGVAVADFVDLAPFEVAVLHPGRTLIEKLLRVNNFAADQSRRDRHDGWPRIGRQFYDVWALLGAREVLDLLDDRQLSSKIMNDAMTESVAFTPDLAPQPGGFASSPAFDLGWEHSAKLRSEHDQAMRYLYYGSAEPPTFDAVIDRVHQASRLLDISVV